jgi:hypothetical protein
MSKHATIQQIIAAMALLKEHLITVEGGVLYAPGWSDERVAVEVSAPIGSVIRLRRKEFGSFAHFGKARKSPGRPKGMSPNAEILRKLDDLLEKVGEINTSLEKLTASFS